MDGSEILRLGSGEQIFVQLFARPQSGVDDVDAILSGVGYERDRDTRDGQDNHRDHQNAGPGAEPAGLRTFELHVYLPFMRSFGQAALVC